jgi:hypothetical protein
MYTVKFLSQHLVLNDTFPIREYFDQKFIIPLPATRISTAISKDVKPYRFSWVRYVVY